MTVSATHEASEAATPASAAVPPSRRISTPASTVAGWPAATAAGITRGVIVPPSPTTHEYPAERVHFTWDAGNEQALTVESGDTVVIEARDVTDGQITPDSTSADVATLDFSRVYPLAGPIAVAGAEAGDTLAVEVVELETRGWGFAAIIPGIGLLSEDFTEPYLRIFDLTGGTKTRLENAVVPIEPFFGTMGVCPAGASQQAVMPPGTFGGNVDIRHLTAGTTLYLPVQVDGALFSCGDAHAAQGDGEVCVTAIEAPMGGVLRFELQKGRSLPAPQYRVPGPLTPRTNTAGWYATTGVGPDLYAAAQDAVRALVDHVSATYGLSPEDAYVLASLVADFKISEIVDAGQFIVSAFLPLSVFPS
jgi:acetamidase/formamidase